jgi:hypothetical protein
MPDTRFRSKFNKLALLNLVAVVAKTGRGSEPELITQRAWDAARAQAGYSDAPSARQIVRRLEIPWAELLELCLESKDPGKALGRREGVGVENWATEEEAISNLRVVAGRLGVKTLTPDQYESDRQALISADQRRWLHGGNLEMVTIGQIETLFGSWDEALERAGLEPRKSPTPKPRGLGLLEALDLFLAENGGLPNRAEFERWARNGRLVIAREKGKSWEAVLTDLRAERDARGQWTPPAITFQRRRGRRRRDGGTNPSPLALASSSSTSSTSLDELPRRSNGRPTESDLEQAMRAFLNWLPSNERPTQRTYRRYCREHPGTPWPSAFDAHGGWGTVRDRVLTEKRAPTTSGRPTV